MTAEEAKEWFEKMKDYHPSFHQYAVLRDGVDGFGYRSCDTWEGMYQAFKARMLDEIRRNED